MFLTFWPSYNLGANLRQLGYNLDPISNAWAAILAQLEATWEYNAALLCSLEANPAEATQSRPTENLS